LLFFIELQNLAIVECSQPTPNIAKPKERFRPHSIESIEPGRLAARFSPEAEFRAINPVPPAPIARSFFSTGNPSLRDDPTDIDLRNPEYWRCRALDAREMAESMSSSVLKERMQE
jgi:hypothetical protein